MQAKSLIPDVLLFYSLNFTIQNINELNVFMPVHDTETGISWITVAIAYISYKIWKICILIQINGVDVCILLHR